MSRQIKFRGWDGATMHDVYYVTPKGIGALGTGSMIIPREGSPHALMQFTGLKGINAADIYEGDIVVSHYSNKRSTPSAVTYVNYLGFTPVQEPVDYDEVYTDKWEVIGNIYQNPELLP